MGLQHLLAALRDELRRRTHAATFHSRAKGNPVLADHPSLGALLEFLKDSSADTYAARDALLRALLVEHQRGAATPSQDSTWAGALLVAFSPMLRALRRRLRGEIFTPSELDALVLEGFLDSLHRCPVHARSVCGRLRLDTHRFVMRALLREQRRHSEQRALSECARGNHEFVVFEWRAEPGELEADEQEELEALLRALVAEAITKPRLELVIATRLRGRPLPSLVNGAGPGADREYQRLKRERTRTLAQLRELLRDRLSPSGGDLAFDLTQLRAAS